MKKDGEQRCPSSSATFWVLGCWGTCHLTPSPSPRLCPGSLLQVDKCRMEGSSWSSLERKAPVTAGVCVHTRTLQGERKIYILIIIMKLCGLKQAT